MLARKFKVRVTYAIVPSQCICAAKCLLFGADVATHFLLPPVVDGVLVARKIIGAGEDCIARLASAWVDSFALVRARLGVEVAARGTLWPPQGVEPMRLSMAFALVLLQQYWRLKSLRTAVIRARVRTTVGTNVVWPSRAGGHRCIWRH